MASYAARGFATEILLYNDTFAALRAGTPDGWGVAVICGSGMNAVGRAPDGRVARFTGLGDIAGDRGGGSGLGMWGLGAAVRAVDGAGRRRRCRRWFPRISGSTTPDAVTEAFYAGRIAGAPGGGAGAGRCPGRAGRRPVSIGLVSDVADEIAAYATASIRRLACNRRPCRSRSPAGSPEERRTCSSRARRRWCVSSRRSPSSRCSTRHRCWAPRCFGLDRLAPGNRAASDRLRAEIAAWDATGGPRPARS